VWENANPSASVAGIDTQVQFNDGGVLGADSGLTFSKTLGSLSIGGKTVTADAPVLDLTQTWNNAGVTFSGIKLNVTDTASNAVSPLLNLQTGGSTVFRVDKVGRTSAVSYRSISGNLAFFNDTAFDFGGAASATAYAQLNQNRFLLRSNIQLSWSTSTISASGALGLSILREENYVLAQRLTTNAQTFRLYGTYTDVSNYRRLKVAMSTIGVAEINPEGAGTGASGNVLHISGLPTSNPGAGILWNNGGTVEVGT
jgi:hypothetical protein